MEAAVFCYGYIIDMVWFFFFIGASCFLWKMIMPKATPYPQQEQGLWKMWMKLKSCCCNMGGMDNFDDDESERILFSPSNFPAPGELVYADPITKEILYPHLLWPEKFSEQIV